MQDTIKSRAIPKPIGRIGNDHWRDIDYSNLSESAKDDLDTVETLLKHLNMIKELQDQMDAIDYLSDNAEKMAENPVYETNDEKVMTAILDLGASGNEVNFELFKYAIEVVLEGYRQMAVISMSGVMK